MSSRATRSVRALLLSSVATFSGCFPYPVQETPHVSGTVVDAATQHPVAGAHVYFEHYQEQPAITERDGHFDIASISRVEMMPLAPLDRGGDRYLIVEAAGYQPRRLKANIWRGPSNEKIVLQRQ